MQLHIKQLTVNNPLFFSLIKYKNNVFASADQFRAFLSK